MPNTEDLRYVRTEAAIREAFLALAAEGGAGRVSATQLCRRAGISRNAFYLHYAGVDALHDAMVGELVGELRAEAAESARRLAASGESDEGLAPAVLGAFAGHEAMLRTLLPSDDGRLAKRLAEGLEEGYVEAGMLVSSRGGSQRHRLSCAFSAWAHVGFVMRWIAMTDRPLPEAEGGFCDLQNPLSAVSTAYLTTGGQERYRVATRVRSSPTAMGRE